MANPSLVRISTVTPPSSFDLVDLTTVKADLGITDSASDARLKRYITANSVAAEQYCNRDLVVEAVEDDFYPQRDAYPMPVFGGVAPLQLSHWPIVTLTSVVENAITLVQGTDFIVDAAKGQLTRLDVNAYPRPWPTLPISVVYTGGYSPIPADIVDKIVQMVRRQWYASSRDPLVRQQSVPGVLEQNFWVPTGTDAGNLTPDVKDVLSNYREPVTAGA